MQPKGAERRGFPFGAGKRSLEECVEGVARTTVCPQIKSLFVF